MSYSKLRGIADLPVTDEGIARLWAIRHQFDQTDFFEQSGGLDDLGISVIKIDVFRICLDDLGPNAVFIVLVKLPDFPIGGQSSGDVFHNAAKLI